MISRLEDTRIAQLPPQSQMILVPLDVVTLSNGILSTFLTAHMV